MCAGVSFSWLSPHRPMTRWFKRRPTKCTLSSPLQPPVGPPAPPQAPLRLTLWGKTLVLLLHSWQGKDLQVRHTRSLSVDGNVPRTASFKIESVSALHDDYISFQVKSHKNHRGRLCRIQRTENQSGLILQYPQTLRTKVMTSQM